MPSWSQLQFTNHEPIVALRETFVNSTNKLYIVCFWFYISIYCYIPHGSTFGTQGLITSANACISAFSHPFISSPINSLESTKDCKKYFSPPRIHRPISSNDSHVWYSWITVVRNSYVTGCLTILSWTVLNVHRNVVCQSIFGQDFSTSMESSHSYPVLPKIQVLWLLPDTFLPALSQEQMAHYGRTDI